MHYVTDRAKMSHAVPTVHNVQSVPLYDDETKHLKSINTTFEESVSILYLTLCYH